MFVSLDGLDGTGKSTQCRRLVEWLRAAGRDVEHVIDPGGTPLGAQLREILLGRAEPMAVRAEALLFMASRAELVETRVRPALARGAVVVSDRFTLSNVAYQGHAGGLDPDEVWAVGRMATGGLEPDLTLVLDLDVEAAQLRLGRAPDRMESRALEYRRRVRAGFLAEAARRPERVRVIDAGRDADAVWGDVMLAVGLSEPEA